MELLLKSDHKFDPIYIKIMYFKKLKKIYNIYGTNIYPKHWNEIGLQELIMRIKNCDKIPYYISYDVLVENGEDFLIERRKKIDDPIIKILSAEECFSVILKAHKESTHGDAEAITKITDQYCRYPIFCINLLIQSCNVCKQVAKFYTVKECAKLETSKSIWQLSIQSYYSNYGLKSGKCNYIFIYMEVVTKFVIIRPLIRLFIEDLGMVLMKIFSTFGLPEKILAPADHEEFLLKTLTFLAVLNPDYLVPVGRCNENGLDAGSVLTTLKKWCKKTGSNAWEIGCHIVQWKYNTSLRVINEKTCGGDIEVGIPYNLFFGKEANVFNHVSGDIVSEQLSLKSRSCNCISIKVATDKGSSNVVDLSSDESGDEDSENVVGRCGVCNEEFVIHDCATCDKPVHYKCAEQILVEVDSDMITKLVCISCTSK